MTTQTNQEKERSIIGSKEFNSGFKHKTTHSEIPLVDYDFDQGYCLTNRQDVIRGLESGNTCFHSANLASQDLSGLNLSDCDFRYAMFNNANLTDVNLTNSNLTHANLCYADLTRANLTRADLTDIILVSANLSHTKF